MTPNEFFQNVSDALSSFTCAWRAALALVLLIYMYRFPFRWESVLIFLGLGMIVASPWLKGVATIGEILFWPGALVFVARQYRQTMELYPRGRSVSSERLLVEYAAKKIFTK